MIDPDMKKYVAAELAPGERVLWAEKTDIRKRDVWIVNRVKSDKLHAPLFFIFGIMFLSIGANIFINRVPSANIALAITASLPALVFGFFGLLVFFVSVKSYFNGSTHDTDRPIGGYVLTSQRLLIFDLDYEFLSSLNATKIIIAKPFKRLENNFKWNTIALTISPVKGVFLRCAELYFLHDFKKAELQINDILKEQTNE